MAVLIGCGAAWGQETVDENPVEGEQAQTEESSAAEAAPVEEARPEDSMSGSLDDSSGSIENTRETIADLLYQGWQVNGDLRVGLVRVEKDERDGTSETTESFRGRFRIGGSYNVTDWLNADARIATSCTSDECNPSATLDPSIDTRTSIDEGTITFDEFYLHVFRLERFDVALGRLQTKFVTRAGVFAKSLDRNNSNNFNINWTDGVHGTYRFPNESIVHLISEYNDADGPSSVRRGPLDFTDSDSRVSHFLAWESQRRIGPITQRGIDISYLPSALLKDGVQTGPIEDYVGIVARMVTAHEFGSKGRRWNVSAEIGYAPETPSRAAVNLAGDGDADGLAWAVTASIMELWPKHSIGINYGRAGAGWLLSPQYRDNEQLAEIRYMWRKRSGLAIEARLRWREELEQQVIQMQPRDEIDFFARFTLGFSR